ncbi:Gfo/Idh/MocA family protein [Aquisalibacillus elongatus]|uniref:Putative dehydrogenase n=1 Tax=Aquisalibacillus elongatus TaxID=485577 RepID=A0A3N5B971_9BACI|nr:Gfo/Idh/MocA family oxidoreductase [Aquisalibacillus elongatus]RPF54276.1 putative dehydrogenase [Aquisalibacillus elongatus]
MLKVGIIGVDTSHAIAFTQLLNDSKQVQGATVVSAYPGGSPDFPLSINRVPKNQEKLSKEFGVEIRDSIQEVAEEADAILLESSDGRVHLEQFRQLVNYRKPVFIDKPLALSVPEAKEIYQLAETYQVPIMSCSTLRYSDCIHKVKESDEELMGLDVFGPLEFQETQDGYFWYGIHLVEMMVSVMGTNVKSVSVQKTDEHEIVIFQYDDGRIGSIRANKRGSYEFGATGHFLDYSQFVTTKDDTNPFYANLLNEVVSFFYAKQTPIAPSETLQVIALIETINQAREG